MNELESKRQEVIREVQSAKWNAEFYDRNENELKRKESHVLDESIKLDRKREEFESNKKQYEEEVHQKERQYWDEEYGKKVAKYHKLLFVFAFLFLFQHLDTLKSTLEWLKFRFRELLGIFRYSYSFLQKTWLTIPKNWYLAIRVIIMIAIVGIILWLIYTILYKSLLRDTIMKRHHDIWNNYKNSNNYNDKKEKCKINTCICFMLAIVISEMKNCHINYISIFLFIQLVMYYIQHDLIFDFRQRYGDILDYFSRALAKNILGKN